MRARLCARTPECASCPKGDGLAARRAGAGREDRDVPGRNEKVRARLLEYALSLPEAWQDEPWEGDVVAKVGKKIFVFLGSDRGDGRVGLSVKLPVSVDEALAYPFTEPTGYGLGRWGWVSATFARGDSPPVDLLEEWIEESYRAIAPKKLVKLLDASA
jgi:predicted DNA-binding protein (MmcQ/YjbR family)